MSDVVTIESLASGGSGVAHFEDGMAVFVPRTAPGDTVRLRDVVRHKRHATARIAEIVTAGPGRIDPPCRHYTDDRCGGCQWQHVSASVQAESKRRIVGDALRRIGKIDVPDPELIGSPRAFNYRTTITLTVRWRGDHPVVGFHDNEDPDRVFMLDQCPIARDEINEMWRAFKPKLVSLPKADDVRLKLRLDDDGLPQMIIESGEPHTSQVMFAQVNAEVAAMLSSAVITAAGGGAVGQCGRRVLDLYAGAGDTALPIAQLGHDVVMVEMDSRAVRRAEERARESGVRIKAIVGTVEDHLAKLLPADVVIVNPPRAGLSEAVAATLPHSPAARLIYVSCDPATLARDLKRMNIGAGQIELVRAFDMFPQTSHVETLVVASRRPSAHSPQP